MKGTINLISLVVLMMACGVLAAQQPAPQEFTIPLSNPNAKGKLIVDLHDGGVSVEGYSGKDVIVSVKTRDDDEEERTREGLRRIPNMGASFEIVEEDNVVYIDGDNKRQADYTVKVPRDFSLRIKTHHNGDVMIRNVSGEIEVDGHHDDITIENVSGSVVADTHHGDIKVTFAAVTSGVPMAFSTYHGDVDITFPSNINASAKMKSDKGDIYTDFEMKVNPSKPQMKSSDRGARRIIVSDWVHSEIGSGGPEYMFTTHHGDIILRKR